MRKVLSIIQYTFIGNMRNRIFLILILFGCLILGASILLGLLGQEEGIRILTDLGLASIEVLALFTSIFLMVQIILEEIESKTIYMVLTRSVSKVQYLLGRFIGTIVSVSVCMVIMTLAHLSLLWFKGWKFEDQGFLYLLSVFMSFEKILIICSAALFFSLFSSSAVVALIFTLFTWVLGHFAMELKFLSGEIKTEFTKWIFKSIYYLIPHFQYLNARDLWLTVSDQMPAFLLKGTVFTILYSSACLILAVMVFRKKEF